ncbi:MAG: alpha/beta fold hydrolase [Gammaproteobacteria bacterium]
MPLLRPVLACLSLLLAVNAAGAPEPTLDSVGGRRIESLTLRHPASPDVVVFESGSRGTLDKWGTVLEQVGREATVFAYNRPGYGNSEVTDTPRDGGTIVEELRRLLRHKGLRPPYVLVGHSLGGLYMQQFARTWPAEVKALVLVDSMYPRMVKNPADFPLITRIAGRLAFSRTVWQEISAIDATGEAVLALPGIDDKPIIRLVNQPTSATAIPVDFGAFRTDRATHELVRAMYPNAVTRVVDASHQMPLTHPDIVTAAVRQAIAAAQRR